MPVADDDYRKKKGKANIQGRGNQYDPMDIIGLGGGGAIGSVAGRVAAPVTRGVVSSAAKFVRGFFSSGGSKASRDVVVKTAVPMPPVPRNLPAVIPRVALRTNAVGRPAPGTGNAGKIGVAAGVAAATGAAYGIGINDAYRGGGKSTSTPTSKPTTSSTGPKAKDLAYFTAEAKKKGKTGKAVSNYAYTMFKDSRMRSGTSASTGQRISGTKIK